jgi:signal transduction histidine kinase
MEVCGGIGLPARREWECEHRVTLDVRDNEAHVSIVDNGVGFDTSSSLPLCHHGVRNLRERARGLGGTVAIQSAPGQGTVVDVQAPIMTPEREGVHV